LPELRVLPAILPQAARAAFMLSNSLVTLV